MQFYHIRFRPRRQIDNFAGRLLLRTYIVEITRNINLQKYGVHDALKPC